MKFASLAPSKKSKVGSGAATEINSGAWAWSQQQGPVVIAGESVFAENSPHGIKALVAKLELNAGAQTRADRGEDWHNATSAMKTQILFRQKCISEISDVH